MPIPEWLSWFIYRPLDWQKRVGYKADLSGKCRASVYGSGPLPHQCARNGKAQFYGLWFCFQHFKRVKARDERDSG